MPDADHNMCAMCCHCGNGIQYDKFYFLCVLCNLCICNGCNAKHPSDHKVRLRRAKDRMLAVNALRSGAKCSKCSVDAETRMECNGCDIKICMGCFNETVSDLEGHEHKSFSFIRAPNDYVLPKYELECGSCMLGSSLTHCSRCFEGIMEGEKIYECLGCIDACDDSRCVCESCLPIAKAEHVSSHEWLSITFREVKKEEAYQDGRCAECLEETKMTHQHKTFVIEQGSISFQKRRHEAYRECPRHAVRDFVIKDEDMHDGELGCHVCYKRFLKDAKAYRCFKCSFESCAYCYETGITSHPHPMTRFFLSRPTPPEDLWIKLVCDEQKRWCDICKEFFIYDVQCHFRCRECNEYDICIGCAGKSTTTVSHACGENPDFNVIDPQPMGEAWGDAQVAKAKLYIEEARKEEEAEAEAARQEAEATAAAAAQKRAEEEKKCREQAEAEKRRQAASRLVTPSVPARNRAPSPMPQVVRLAPPAAPQHVRRKSSGSSGMAFLKGALKVTNAVLRVENGMMNANQGGGGGGGTFFAGNSNGGGGSMDMSSFWAPINSAASDPIQ